MRIYTIEAWVMGEKVILFHRASTQTTANEWLLNNEERLTEKGFSGFEVDSYSEDY